jgi:hypothetical protein
MDAPVSFFRVSFSRIEMRERDVRRPRNVDTNGVRGAGGAAVGSSGDVTCLLQS